ncbi:MAG: toll/interleukin-1 receptor domain-containing protein, partial [Acidobacteriaceae bacterium]|nr:toll/interleukin-1 receptor domain-containing protein [Acidobacteriaceae bacterium]
MSHFDEDVFISYAHNDDDSYLHEKRGWVAQLDDDLQNRIKVWLDGEKPSVWRDPAIRPNEDFEQKICARLARTAILLSIISPSYLRRDWCIRELEEFASYAEKTLGIRIDEEKSRIFKVEKVPVDRQTLPEQLQRTGSYKFYGPDPVRGRVHEFRPLLGNEDSRPYFLCVDDLAQDIAAVLKRMAAKALGLPEPGAQLPAIYLAETTADMEEQAAEIRRELKGRGYTVLPAGDLPYRV